MEIEDSIGVSNLWLEGLLWLLSTVVFDIIDTLSLSASLIDRCCSCFDIKSRRVLLDFPFEVVDVDGLTTPSNSTRLLLDLDSLDPESKDSIVDLDELVDLSDPSCSGWCCNWDFTHKFGWLYRVLRLVFTPRDFCSDCAAFFTNASEFAYSACRCTMSVVVWRLNSSICLCRRISIVCYLGTLINVMHNIENRQLPFESIEEITNINDRI